MMPRTVTASSSEDSAEDLFTPEFKRLKARNPPPDLSRVIDLDKLNLASQTELLTSSDQVCISIVFLVQVCFAYKSLFSLFTLNLSSYPEP